MRAVAQEFLQPRQCIRDGAGCDDAERIETETLRFTRYLVAQIGGFAQKSRST
jgi:hypothetical protein